MVRALDLAALSEVFLATADTSSQLSREARAGRVRRLGARLYTTNLKDPPESVVKRNMWPIVGLLFPGSVVSHRTAFDTLPTPSGTVFLTGAYARVVELPGLRIRQLKGPGPQEGDNRFVQALWLASAARALLECLSVRRVRGPDSPGVPRAAIEERLERLVRFGSEDGTNRIRDLARRIAPALGAQAALHELDTLIGALMGTRKAALTAPTALARAAGEPYDSGRVQLFTTLHAALLAWVPAPRPDPSVAGPAFENLAFVDAYFSNFIEGTEFEVQEAVDIVFENRIPRARPEDAHDIIGTYRLVSDPGVMGHSAVAEGATFDGFVSTLRSRHAVLMGGRPDKRPGEFKMEVNRAGLTVFVDPPLVVGTLRQGFEIMRSLSEPFQRAAMAMFVVSEVHPFDDGNGRIARVMMNAELVAGLQRRILVPTAYRDDYLLALRALSRRGNPDPLLKMLDYAQAFAAAIEFADLRRALDVLRACNAFERDTEARLRMPA